MNGGILGLHKQEAAGLDARWCARTAANSALVRPCRHQRNGDRCEWLRACIGCVRRCQLTTRDRKHGWRQDFRANDVDRGAHSWWLRSVRQQQQWQCARINDVRDTVKRSKQRWCHRAIVGCLALMKAGGARSAKPYVQVRGVVCQRQI